MYPLETQPPESYLLPKKQLNDLEQRNREAVKVRVKARFMEEGEKSTRYFCSLEKWRQAHQTIQTLTISCTRDILFEMHAFYKALYIADNMDPQAQSTFFDTSIPWFPDTDRQSHENLLSPSELETALNKMENNKNTSGPPSDKNSHEYLIIALIMAR